MRYLKLGSHIILFIFAGIGFIFTLVFVGMYFGWFNVSGSIDERNSFFDNSQKFEEKCSSTEDTCQWTNTSEWATVSAGLQKDSEIINRVSLETGVPSRMIVAMVVPEQLRFFTDEREIYKRVFEPLKILGSLSKFSLGVSGIKQETADQIEQYANDTSSPFYVGSDISQLIAYDSNTESHDEALYNRLTDANNHYYSYLYTAIFIKEVEGQWQKAGYQINDRPEIIATLFNLGFQSSYPKADPKVGGASIEVGGQNHSFGELAGQFYYSEELLDEFPM